MRSPLPQGQFYYIKSYGCQMNSYDSEKMAAILSSQLNMSPVDTPELADICIMNTCSIREKAQEKVFSELGRWRVAFEKHRQNRVVVVAGCVASQEADQLVKRAPMVNLVIGPQTIHRLKHLYQAYLDTQEAQIDVAFPEIEKFNELPNSPVAEVSSYLSVMEGCNKYCSYCIVPYTRGEEISRPFADILQEAKHLVQAGAREIVLLGQNVNDYLGNMPNDQDQANLSLLIHAISKINGVARIRFTTSHPAAFDESLIDAFAHTQSKLCNHLHLPIQSGSDRVLSLMKRDYTASQYLEIIKKLRALKPDITLSTDIIVGFPGETEEDFQATLALAKIVGFDHSFCFIYSPRPGTPASEMQDDVDQDTKKKRLYALQQVLYASRDAISASMLHRTVSVLVETTSRTLQSGVTGRTESNRAVHFQAPASLIGSVVPVTITHIAPHSLQGRLVASCAEPISA